MTFYLLALSILCVFPYCKVSFIKQPLWLWLMALTVIYGFIESHLNIVGLVAIVLYIALYYGALYLKSSIIRTISAVLFIVSSLALAIHLVPGFNNLPIVINELITLDAIPYTLYANLDKGMAGLFVCAYFFSMNKTAIKKDVSNDIKINVKQPVIIILSTILATLTVALMLGIVNFNPKVPNFWLAFIAINLLFTCVAEEALFRGVLQTKLSQLITSTRLKILAPIIIACVFALAHFMGGLSYIAVAVVAGFGYGYIFYKTQRLEWAILCHWLVNVCHFFLFTYPMLKLQA